MDPVVIPSALIPSITSVALAEMGDKTQLLTLLLAVRFRNRAGIVFGILLATVLNHGLSALAGGWLGVNMDQWLSSQWLNWIMAGCFIAMGIWLLVPDEEDGINEKWMAAGAFVATFVLFSLAELGDKTQIVTVMLAAQFQQPLTVAVGTTIGMLLANVPLVWFGRALVDRLPMVWIHRITAALFIGSGLWLLLA
ncbi:TMEM165/GDT1 family protein [Oceanobacter mangrovi]|uniref:TMEM165/GDT1 family protein n=1 Tax=Oceanobacter mangrovi TaxID=2862510 RepID=UPI001FE713F1|nr:TMEM165/GDT1 family protein [Oceanobacter mangrovi]